MFDMQVKGRTFFKLKNVHEQALLTEPYAKSTSGHLAFTVYFSHFLRLPLKFSKRLLHHPHLITCARHKSNYWLFWRNCNSFGTFMQMIMHNGLFSTLSMSHVLPPKNHLGISPIFQCIHHYMQNGWASYHNCNFPFSTMLHGCFLTFLPIFW